jgi:hypothetical protein
MTLDNRNIVLRRLLSEISIETSMDDDIQQSKSKLNEIKTKLMLKIEIYVK